MGACCNSARQSSHRAHGGARQPAQAEDALGHASDGFLDLAASGALDMDFPHTTCVLVGSRDFYGRVADFTPLRVQGCEITHDIASLARKERLVAVNSALEVVCSDNATSSMRTAPP